MRANPIILFASMSVVSVLLSGCKSQDIDTVKKPVDIDNSQVVCTSSGSGRTCEITLETILQHAEKCTFTATVGAHAQAQNHARFLISVLKKERLYLTRKDKNAAAVRIRRILPLASNPAACPVYPFETSTERANKFGRELTGVPLPIKIKGCMYKLEVQAMEQLDRDNDAIKDDRHPVDPNPEPGTNVHKPWLCVDPHFEMDDGN